MIINAEFIVCVIARLTPVHTMPPPLTQRDGLAQDSEGHVASDELTRLRIENAELRAELNFVLTHPGLSQGLRGELLLSDITGLQHGKPNAPFDLFGPTASLEIKYSALRPNRRGSHVLRWTWGKLLGQGGKKIFDQLILIGEADPRYCSMYADPMSPYVYFDIPATDVPTIVAKGGTASTLIRLSSNPMQMKSHAGILYSKYQTTRQELQLKYRVS